MPGTRCVAGAVRYRRTRRSSRKYANSQNRKSGLVLILGETLLQQFADDVRKGGHCRHWVIA
jgi:hypothetical protein